MIPDRVKFPWTFDASRMVAEVDGMIHCEWIEHFVTQNYEGDWSVIPLRGPQGAEHPVMMIYSDPTCEQFEDTPFLKQCDYLKAVLAHFKCPLQAVRLMRLGVGSEIREHCDHDLAFEDGFVRLHIPVTTNENVTFLLNGSEVKLVPGSCWYLRLSDPHQVFNRGQTDRVHLVIDAKVNQWLAEELIGASVEAC